MDLEKSAGLTGGEATLPALPLFFTALSVPLTTPALAGLTGLARSLAGFAGFAGGLAGLLLLALFLPTVASSFGRAGGGTGLASMAAVLIFFLGTGATSEDFL